MTTAKAKPKLATDQVTVRVLKKGDGKISAGKRLPDGRGDVYYKFKDEFETTREIGEGLEERGFGEIQD